jgi:hypothetical protein
MAMLRGEEELVLGKYAKLAVLATLCEPKSLSELGIFWYKENGRFYKQKAKDEVEKAVNDNILVKKGAKYMANTQKIVSQVYSEMKVPDEKALLLQFWSHPFSQKTYLCCESVKQLFSRNPEKASEADLSLVLNTPLILHKLQKNDPEAYSAFIGLQGLENYTNTINAKAEKNLVNNFRNLSEKTDWLDNLDQVLKNNGFLLELPNNNLKIRQLMRGMKK